METYTGRDKKSIYLCGDHSFMGFVRNQNFAQFPRKSSATAFAYVFPYLMLRATGYRSSFYEETLQLLRRRERLRNADIGALSRP